MSPGIGGGGQSPAKAFCPPPPGENTVLTSRLPVQWICPFWLAALLLLALAPAAHAHDPGLSAVALRFQPNQLHADLSLSPTDARLLAGTLEIQSDGQMQPQALAGAQAQLEALAANALEVAWNGHRVQPTKVAVQAGDSRTIHLLLDFPRETTSQLGVRSALLSRLSRGHRQYFALRGEQGELLGETLLDAGHPCFEKTFATVNVAVSAPHSFTQFLLLGVEHILTGYDHLCFLFGLLIAGGSIREVLKIITAFTLAHSITLALATLNLINLPPRIIEPMIAVSIIYVGIENILRRDLRRRWLLSFGFGLVHGCGFASALRDLGIGSDGRGIAVPLLSFNLGVELGQVTIAALLLPLIWKLKERPAFAPRYAPACSVLVSLAGAYWLIQRVWWS
ncbi:MAG: hypothetical protein JWR19_2559 [Pedosphaera sp.]|nr:hypothetical protein [Pedosphaera sp.]